MTQPDLKIDRARWWALREQPFYGQLAMGLTDHIDPSVPTACTDGASIRWGKDFLAGLTDEETRYILLHEALHCAHGHLWRLPHDATGNEAGDYQIEHILRSVPGVTMPKDGLICPADMEGLAEEEIYARLAARPKDEQGGEGDDGDGLVPDPCGSFTAPAAPAGKPGQDDGQGQGAGSPANDGSGDAGPDGSGAASDTLQDQWERRVIQAAQAAQATGQGSLPADMQRELDRLRSQHIDWRQEMAEFVRDAASSRNDWSRAARRHAWQRVIYPRRRADDIGLVIFARDTSGSIDHRLCAEFSALISSCLAETGCRGLVLDCDAAIQQEIDLAPGEECPLTAKGGGGTDFRPVFDRAAELIEQGERVAGLVYLTDLYGDFPAAPPEVATLWLATSAMDVPFGRVVRIDG